MFKCAACAHTFDEIERCPECGSEETRRLRRGRHPAIVIMLLVGILALAMFVPEFLRARAQGQLSGCNFNLKNIATALEMYSTDWQGHYPTRLEMLVPDYLDALPHCPVAAVDTYSRTYHRTVEPDFYAYHCGGHNHAAAGVPADQPGIDSLSDYCSHRHARHVRHGRHGR